MTNLKKMMAPLALVVGLVAAAPGTAHATKYKTVTFNGNLCEAYSPDVSHNGYGILNLSATDDPYIYCPITIDFETGSGIPVPFSSTFGVGLYDRNDTAGMDVTCTLKATSVSTGNHTSLGSVTSTTGGPVTGY